MPVNHINNAAGAEFRAEVNNNFQSLEDEKADKTSTDSSIAGLQSGKLGKTEQSVDAAKLGGKSPSAYSDKLHSHGADDLPAGSTTEPGIVQLNNSTTSAVTTQAATPKAVRDAKAAAIAQGVPVGVITMFAGTEAQVPSGWQLCNGSGTTSTGIAVPDLRDRFVIGAGATHPVGTTGGSETSTTSNNGSHSHTVTVNSAGAHSHSITVDNTTLTEAQMPSHSHKQAYSAIGGDGYDGSKRATSGYGLSTLSAGGSGAHNHSASSSTAGDHSHTATGGSAGNHTHTVDVVPLYFSIALIIKL